MTNHKPTTALGLEMAKQLALNLDWANDFSFCIESDFLAHNPKLSIHQEPHDFIELERVPALAARQFGLQGKPHQDQRIFDMAVLAVLILVDLDEGFIFEGDNGEPWIWTSNFDRVFSLMYDLKKCGHNVSIVESLIGCLKARIYVTALEEAHSAKVSSNLDACTL